MAVLRTAGQFCSYCAGIYDKFDQNDADRDGSLSMDEILLFDLPVSKKLFDLLDSDGDGKVSKSELQTTLDKLRSSQGKG